MKIMADEKNDDTQVTTTPNETDEPKPLKGTLQKFYGSKREKPKRNLDK